LIQGISVKEDFPMDGYELSGYFTAHKPSQCP
jgi:hypothetical protein